MISVAVCDDSSSMIDSMEKILNRYVSECAEEIRVIKFYSGDKLLENYKGIYDVIFLDIKMPRMNGIEAAEKIREKDDKVTIIFLTSLLNLPLSQTKKKYFMEKLAEYWGKHL